MHPEALRYHPCRQALGRLADAVGAGRVFAAVGRRDVYPLIRPRLPDHDFKFAGALLAIRFRWVLSKIPHDSAHLFTQAGHLPPSPLDAAADALGQGRPARGVGWG